MHTHCLKEGNSWNVSVCRCLGNVSTFIKSTFEYVVVTIDWN